MTHTPKNRTNHTVIIFLILAATFYSCKSNDKAAAPPPVGPSYDSLKAVHDSLVSQFNASGSRVDELSTRAMVLDSAVQRKDAEIARLKKEVKSLGRKNKTLAAKYRKNESLVATLKNELGEKEQSVSASLALLRAEKDKLSQQLADILAKYNSLKELGSVLHASNIRLEALHLKHNGKKEKRTRKARKLDVLRIHFDIDENRIAEDGIKKLYLVVTGPDDKLLSDGGNSSGSITTRSGQVVRYSLVKEISLRQNEPVNNVSVDWKETGSQEKGTYSISFYNGGYKIGSSNVILN